MTENKGHYGTLWDATDLEKGCGSSFYRKGNVTQICGWKKGINRVTGVLLCPECEKIRKERQRLKDVFLKKAQECDGSIKTEEDLWEHIKRLEECSNCNRVFWDKLCPDCFISKAKVEKSFKLLEKCVGHASFIKIIKQEKKRLFG